MSVPVDLAELAEKLQHYNFAYLMTVGEDQRAHAVAVRPSLDGDVLQVEGLGRRTRANLEARPGISLVWPPFEHGGYSLILDGRASLTDGTATVTPEHAVLHRPAEEGAAPGATGCGNDCVPLGEG
ncbi:MAG: pyridoxamine 5'-phosphate oxidase family protein [Nocardioides sp.]